MIRFYCFSTIVVSLGVFVAFLPTLLPKVLQLAAKSPDDVLLMGLLRRSAGLNLNKERREQQVKQLKNVGFVVDTMNNDYKRLLPINDSSDPGYVFPALKSTGTFQAPMFPQPVTLWHRVTSVGWMLQTLMYHEFGLVTIENAREAQAKIDSHRMTPDGENKSFFNKTGFHLFDFPGHEYFNSYSDELFMKEKSAFRQALKEHIKLHVYPNAKEIAIADLEFRAGDGRAIKNAKLPVKGAHRDHLSSFLFMPEEFYAGMDPDVTEIGPFYRAHEEGTLLILAAWKPVNMQRGVCRESLALLDASTVQVHDEHGSGARKESDIVPIRNNIIRNNTLYQNDAGLLAFDRDRHRWMIYPDMQTNELLVFLHYEPGTERGVFHSGVDPQESRCTHSERRNSVEARIMIRL